MNQVHAERFDATRAALRTSGLAAGIITSPVSMKYLCGWSNPSKRFAGLVVPADGEPMMVVPALEAAEAGRSAVKALRTWRDGENPFAVVGEVLAAAGARGRPVAVEKESMPLAVYERLAEGVDLEAGALLPQLGDLTPVILGMREIKSEAELTLMQKAADMLVPALAAGMRAIRPGITERQLAAVLEQAMTDAGAQGFAFDTHVLFGDNAALPHGHCGDRALQPGETIIMDFGALYEGYRSDITRTVCLGDWPAEMARVYDTVLAAHDAAIAAVRPGVEIGEIDRAARRVIEEAGYGEYFIHRTGHGLGLEVHEEPYAVGGNAKLLRPGHVFTIEPGIYLQGVGGVRIEDDVVVTETGCRILTSGSTARLSIKA